MSTSCVAAGCSKTTKDGVRSDVFSSAVQQTLRAVVLRKSGIHHIFWHKEKSYFLKHDAIPTIFPARGKSKKVPERRDESKEHLPNVKTNRVLFQLWGHVFSWRQASLSCVGTACDSPCWWVIRVDRPHSSHTVLEVCSVTVSLYVGIIPITYLDVVYGARLHIFSSNIAPRLTSRTAPCRLGPTFKFVIKMETNFSEP